MSPEQARGDMIDGRTDIWSLGVVLYEMAAGCSPFMAGTSNEIISGILSKEAAPPISRFVGDVPVRLEEIIEKAVTKNREERYQTSKDLLIDLKTLKRSLELQAGIDRSTSPEKFAIPSAEGRSSEQGEGGTIHTRSASSVEYVVDQVKTHKLRAIVTLAVLLTLTAAIIYVWRRGARTFRQARPR